MKKILILLAVVILNSCSKDEKPQYTVFSGSVENSTSETAKIRSDNFEATLELKNGVFKDTLEIPKDGLYEFFVGRERTGIYLEKGKNLSVTLNSNEFDETLRYDGDLKNENNFLAAKNLMIERTMNYKTLYDEPEERFLNKVNKQYSLYATLFQSHKINNENFKEIIKMEDRYSKAVLIENYQEAHRYYSGDEKYTVSANFYNSLKDIDYKDTLAYRNYTSYQNLLQTHYNRLVTEEAGPQQSKTVLYLQKVDSVLPDGFAKDKLMIDYLQFGLQPDESLDEAYTIYKNSDPNPEKLEALTKRYNKLSLLTKGNDSPDFEFENHKGGKTALADLKGKFVYIDIWATWCGPCIREIPALQEVEEDYKKKNIAFVSISIDETKDYEKWKTMVAEKQLGGIQLMADNNWKSEFVESYDILGIPRFILLDPNGKIVSADAPRPSDPKLRDKLDSML